MNRTPSFLSVLGLAALCASAFAQELPTAVPESVGISPERIARIGDAVDAGIADRRIAGAVTLVIRHGDVVWFDARGMADRESGKPMQKDSIFRICSMTRLERPPPTPEWPRASFSLTARSRTA
jgi:CubicO group peptidase (beta-lactamase class C family)